MTDGGKESTGQRRAFASVRVEPLGVVLTVHEGETLMQAARRQGYYWPTICNGEVRCSLCSLEVLEGVENLGQPDRDEQVVMELQMGHRLRQLKDRLRLGCCVKPTGDAVVLKRGVRSSGADPQQGQKRP